jgi:hypothetical protein
LALTNLRLSGTSRVNEINFLWGEPSGRSLRVGGDSSLIGNAPFHLRAGADAHSLNSGGALVQARQRWRRHSLHTTRSIQRTGASSMRNF